MGPVLKPRHHIQDAGIKVHVFGDGWDRLPCRHEENLILMNNLDSAGCLKKLGMPGFGQTVSLVRNLLHPVRIHKQLPRDFRQLLKSSGWAATSTI